MNSFFFQIFDYLQRNKRFCIWLLFAIVAILVLLMSNIRYNEDIKDFMPLSGNEQKAISLYQDISGGKRIIVLFHAKDSTYTNRERLAEAVDTFAYRLMSGEGKKHIQDLTTHVDYEKIAAVTDFIYENIPLLLCDSDYRAMEQSLSDSAFVSSRLVADMQLMMMPATGFFNNKTSNDPLGLFSPVLERLQSRQSAQMFEIDNGYIYVKDGYYAAAVLTSPYGAMESAHNAELATYVDSIAMQTMKVLPNVEVEITGAPIIAVGNAQQIKTDSFLAIIIAVTLILALLIFSFRSWKSLLLIGVSIVFGWLFAMGCMAMVTSEVSLIVLGIGSIIIGIAVNYPLHFIAHTDHGGTVRDVLKDMVEPLLIGNITTVGAFAALIPLDAPALHDLGLFAAFMLIGTILFVLIFLPHLIRGRSFTGEEYLSFGKLATKSPDKQRWILGIIALITVVLGYFSLSISFDANMHHINYMSPQQRNLLADVQASSGVNDTSSVYIVAEGKSWDEALSVRQSVDNTLDSLVAQHVVKRYSDVTSFVCSKAEQQRRIDRWNQFWEKHRAEVLQRLQKEASAYGFSEDAFVGFSNILQKKYELHDTDYFEPIISMLLSNSFSTVNENYSVVDVLHVNNESIETVKNACNNVLGSKGYAFDFVGMNSAIANSLSDNFNYIGYACGIIVFLFLWISMGRLELSLLSFLPMALGWIWILGIMQICGMQFNIVNIILATFIFGQGDDYTIFMTEGLINEYAYRRKLLPSYKNSIVISALIMFIGMGSLIVAKHPALYSLAEVTIVGMFTVVLMAWLVPPLMFGWLVRNKQGYRRVPVTLEQVFRTLYSSVWYIFQLSYGCFFGTLNLILPCNKKKKEIYFHKLIYKSMRMNVKGIDGIKVVIKNEVGEDFSRGSIAVCNHQSILDPIYLLALHPKILIVIGEKVWRNPIVHYMFKMSRFINIAQPQESLKENIREVLQDGYNVVFFSEGARSHDGTILRFHKGAFELAQELHADLLPLYLHGLCHVMPKGSAFASRGQITVEVGKRIPAEQIASHLGESSRLAAHNMRLHYIEHYKQMQHSIEKAHYFHHYVIYQYIYKGIAIERNTKRLLKRYDDFAEWIDKSIPQIGDAVIVFNSGQGQFALLYALVHPNTEVHSYAFDKDDAELASYCTGKPNNLYVNQVDNIQKALSIITKTVVHPQCTYLLFPSDEMVQETYTLHPILIK